MAAELIYETVVTSIDMSGQPHIAPFGVRERNGLILIAPFRPSTSLDNFLASRSAVLNITDDVRIFAGALTGHRAWPLMSAEKIAGVYLETALTHKELELVDVKEDATRPELYFKVVHEVAHKPFQGFNRAQAAVVELAVLVSRLHMLPIQKINQEIEYLQIAISKTAGPRELEAWGWLIDKVQMHKAQLNGSHIA